MRDKKLLERIEKYVRASELPTAVYFSRTIPDGRYKNYNYFFKYCSTHSVAVAFKTQKEIKEFLNKEGF